MDKELKKVDQKRVAHAKLPLTVTIITLNEEDRLEKAIQSASFAEEVLVVDSGSTDKTLQIAMQCGAKVATRKWEGFGQQKNFAHHLSTQPWVLNIDADERISPELFQEIKKAIESGDSISGYRIPRKTYYLNRWIAHGGWYPNYLVRLCKKEEGCWTEPPVHEELQVKGKVGTLQADLFHETFRSIEDQVKTNLKYARLGAEVLLNKKRKIFWYHLVLKPLGKWAETYIIKRGFLDGLPGWIISMNAAHSIFLKFAYAWEKQNESTARRQ